MCRERWAIQPETRQCVRPWRQCRGQESKEEKGMLIWVLIPPRLVLGGTAQPFFFLVGGVGLVWVLKQGFFM